MCALNHSSQTLRLEYLLASNNAQKIKKKKWGQIFFIFLQKLEFFLKAFWQNIRKHLRNSQKITNTQRREEF